jgi:hypothetical protein
MRSTCALLASLLLIAASSCGGSAATPNEAVDAGYSSFNAGDYSSGLASFDAALGMLTPDDPKFVEAKLGQLQCLAHTDAKKAKTELLAQPKDGAFGAKDYNVLVTEMIASATAQAQAGDTDAAGATIGEAVALLTDGKPKFPDYTKWDALIKKTGDKVKTLGNEDAMAALKGLGYVGGD